MLRSTIISVVIAAFGAAAASGDVCSRQTDRWGGYGDVTTVTLAEDHLFYGGSVLRVADLSRPHAPITVGNVDLRNLLVESSGIDDIAVADHIAVIGLGADGVAMVDVEDPTRPSFLSSMPLTRQGWPVRAVGIATPMAIVATTSEFNRSMSRLSRVDLVDPAAPVEIDGIDFHGEVQDLVIDGRYALVITSSYTINGGTGIAPATMHVVDLIRWDGPDIVGTLEFPDSEPIAIDATPGMATVLDWHGGVHLLNTVDPQHPQQTGFVDTGASGWGAVSMSGETAYLASAGGLHVVSYSNISAPAVIAAIQDFSYEPGVAVRSGWVFPAAGAHGVHIIDLNNPRNPVFAGATGFPHHADDVASGTGKAVVVDSSYDPQGPPTSVLRVLDVQPQGAVPSFETMIPPGPIAGVVMDGTHFAMSVEIGTISPRCVVRTIDFSAPIHLGSDEEIDLCPFTSSSGIQVDIEGRLMAVLDAQRSAVHLIDLEAEFGPEEVGSWPVDHECTAIALTGDRLFASAIPGSTGDVDIVDITNPSSPFLLETVHLEGGACIDLEADGDTLAAANFHQSGKTGSVDLHLVDIETATVRTTLRGVSQTAILHLDMDDDIVYLRRSNAAASELVFVDLEARWPALRDLPVSGGPGAAFDVSGDLIAWADAASGLLITHVEHCVTPVRDAGDAGRAGDTP